MTYSLTTAVVSTLTSKVTSGDLSSRGGATSAARIRIDGVERAVLTVAGEGGLERRWMAAEFAPRSGMIVGGERNGLVWPTQAYRVVSWEKSGLGYDGVGWVRYVMVKFEPLGRVFYAR